MTSVEHCLNRVIIYGSFRGAKHPVRRPGHQLERKDVDKSLVEVLHAETAAGTSFLDVKSYTKLNPTLDPL